MGKNKSCDETMRAIIVKFHSDGKSYGEIAKTLNVLKRMVFNAIHYFRKNKTTKRVPRKQRPRKTSAREDELIVRESKKFPQKSANEIRVSVFGENNSSPSVETIKRRLRENGLFGRISRKKPLLSERNRKKRLEFAMKYRYWSVKEWKKVFFSDETKINRLSPDGKYYVRRPRSEAYNPKYTRPTLKHGGGNIMVWGAMSWRGVGPITKIEGRMDQHQYISILNEVMLPFCDDNMPVTWIFQQDNDPKHTARATKRWMEEKMIKLLDWPSCSPDLNPIENLWEHLKRKVRLHKIGNFADLVTKVKMEWEAIPNDVCKKLIESMPRRCEAVIRSNGFSTKY